MIGKYKVAHLIGITREHEEIFRHVEKVLTKKGYICFAPVIYDMEEYLSVGSCPNMLDDMCHEKLLISDLIVIVTPEHIGKSTSMRIEQAGQLGIPIYMMINDDLVKFDINLRENINVMTWDEMKAKYPEDREAMTEDREKEFVEDCFSCYENEGFAKKFWSPYEISEYRNGQSFEVVRRCTVEESDLCVLPMWRIKFTDGVVINAFPEEIIPSEMRNSGCILEDIE